MKLKTPPSRVPDAELVDPKVAEDARSSVILDRYEELEHWKLARLKRYTREQAILASMVYVMTGSNQSAADVAEVTPEIVRQWRSSTKWWPEIAEVSRQILSERLEDKLSGLVLSSVYQLERRLSKGDQLLNAKGQRVYRQLPARDVIKVLNSVFDKRQLLKGGVTSRTEKLQTEQLRDIKAEAEEFSKRLDDASSKAEKQALAGTFSDERCLTATGTSEDG